MHFVDRGATTDRWGRERGLGWRGIASKPDSDSDATSGRPEQIRPLRGNAVRFAHTLSRHGRAAASTDRMFCLVSSKVLGCFTHLRQSWPLAGTAMSRRDTFLKHVMTIGPTHVRPRPRPPSGTYTRAPPPSHLITASLVLSGPRLSDESEVGMKVKVESEGSSGEGRSREKAMLFSRKQRGGLAVCPGHMNK